MAEEGEQDEQKKMKLQLEKINVMLQIPYNRKDDDSALQPLHWPELETKPDSVL